MSGDLFGLLVMAIVFGCALMLVAKWEKESFKVNLFGVFVTVFAGYLFIRDVYEYIQKYII